MATGARKTVQRSGKQVKKLSTVLVPIDFSYGSMQALLRASSLPLAEGATIAIVHAVSPALPAGVSIQLRGRARAALAEAAADARAAAGEAVNVTTRILNTRPSAGICGEAERIGADLIVTGRHGERLIADLLIGSTAEKVLRRTSVPMLIVNSSPERPYRRPLVAVDLWGGESLAIEMASRLVDPAVTRFEVVHAVQVPYEWMLRSGGESERSIARLRSQAKSEADAKVRQIAGTFEPNLEWRMTITHGDPRSIIPSLASRKKTDLLCLGTHARGGVEHFLIGSVAESIARSAPCDVLLAPPAGRKR